MLCGLAILLSNVLIPVEAVSFLKQVAAFGSINVNRHIHTATVLEWMLIE